MCILCVASKWSRRIVTMLPWLIIPLIILWALSQLLPPGFRFEVTSPRLACVGVLLVSLLWYELAMPRLSLWRARRSAFLRDRRRIEAQEAAKWRKEATRRCRNCLSAYRDQTPVGGKFMCTYCGHVSRRPVLDVPGATNVGGIPGGLAAQSGGGVHSPPGGGMFSSAATAGAARGGDGRAGSWGGRGWPERMHPPSMVGVSRGWTNNSTRSSSFAGGPYGSWPHYWGWHGNINYGGGGGGGYFGKDKCGSRDGSLFWLFRVFSLVFVCLRWLVQKMWRGERAREDPTSCGRRGSQRRGEDPGTKEGSRGEKARRKAEEKRQARIEREQLDAEERRQREEVARLVEERRRLRDEMMEAERESEREAAAERERELRREREAERRRQEKLKERERELGKDKFSRDIEDSEDSKKDLKKPRDSKVKDTGEKKMIEGDKKLDAVKAVPSQSGSSGDPVKKPGKAGRVDPGVKGTDAKTPAALKAARSNNSVKSTPIPANPKLHSPNSTSFWSKGLTTGGKPAKVVPSPVTSGIQTTPIPCTANGTKVNGKHSDIGYSAWNRMPWTKVWGKGFSTPVAEKGMNQSGVPNNADLSLNAGAASKERGAWNGGTRSLDGSIDLEHLTGLERERDLIQQAGEGNFETLFGQGFCGSNYVAPIGPQPPIHAPVSGMLRDRTAVPQEQVVRPILEPWADDLNSSGRRTGFGAGNELLGVEAISGDGKWQMWEAPQLDKIQLPSAKDTSSPLPWLLPLGPTPKEASPRGMPVSAELETQLPTCLFSPQPQHDSLNCTIPSPLVSHSLWSDQSAFVFDSPSPICTWDESDALLQQPHVPPEFVDCITQEVMQDPVITADGHSYERSAILRWLQTHDTSPITGEVLPPPPGGNLGVDKTLRPNHILRGQIIEYRESLERLSRGTGLHAENVGLRESSSSWSGGLGNAAWSNSMASNTERLNNIGGFYTTPSAQSVWSYNAS